MFARMLFSCLAVVALATPAFADDRLECRGVSWQEESINGPGEGLSRRDVCSGEQSVNVGGAVSTEAPAEGKQVMTGHDDAAPQRLEVDPFDRQMDAGG